MDEKQHLLACSMIFLGVSWWR